MSHLSSLDDRMREHRIYTKRAVLALVCVLCMIGILLSKMYQLQYVEHEKHRTKSDTNRIRLMAIPPTRGLIYDRHGTLLADNRPSYSLTLVKERVGDMSKALASINQIIPLSESKIKRFNRRLRDRRRPYESVALLNNLTQEEIAIWAVNRSQLPGVEVEAQLIRHYPLGESTAHVLGYVGRINDREKKRIDQDRYDGTQHIGKLGVEKQYEDILLGYAGVQHVETNARGRVLRVLDRTAPTPGKNLVLHLDSGLQKITADAFAGRRGAAVAIDVKTGGVLALYSNPSFDPNLFVQGISQKNYSQLVNDLDRPLYNRAIRGQYPPGSTMKPFIALAGLESEVVNTRTTFYDRGYFMLENSSRHYRCWKREGHGRVNFNRGVVESCDIYFYELAHKMGIDRLSPFLAQFGFGDHTGLDVINANRGLLPSREWKKGEKGLSWYPGDTINFGIGQGYMLATPFQLAAATSVLAARGGWSMPRLVNSIDDEAFNIAPEDKERYPLIQLKHDEHWDDVWQAMQDVVHSPRGTARAISKDLTYHIGGKTGTAQVVGIAQNKKYDSAALDERQRDHALFIAFGPVENPHIAIAVVVENGESAGKTAAPIARTIIDAHLERNVKDYLTPQDVEES